MIYLVSANYLLPHLQEHIEAQIGRCDARMAVGSSPPSPERKFWTARGRVGFVAIHSLNGSVEHILECAAEAAASRRGGGDIREDDAGNAGRMEADRFMAQ